MQKPSIKSFDLPTIWYCFTVDFDKPSKLTMTIPIPAIPKAEVLLILASSLPTIEGHPDRYKHVTFEEFTQIFHLFIEIREELGLFKIDEYSSIESFLNQIDFESIIESKLLTVKVVKNTFLLALKDAKDAVVYFIENKQKNEPTQA